MNLEKLYNEVKNNNKGLSRRVLAGNKHDTIEEYATNNEASIKKNQNYHTNYEKTDRSS